MTGLSAVPCRVLYLDLKVNASVCSHPRVMGPCRHLLLFPFSGQRPIHGLWLILPSHSQSGPKIVLTLSEFDDKQEGFWVNLPRASP